MEPFGTLTSKVVVLPIDNIDTDQIIPARFLKGTEKTGLGKSLFADWRYRPDGSPQPDFALNQPENQGSKILFAGDNFGCGSSREHAPWALVDFGLRAAISTSFADIFRNNAMKNGFLPIQVDGDDYRQIAELLAREPETELSIDLPTQEVVLPTGQRIPFPIDGFTKACLIRGTDELGYLLSFSDEIAGYESRRGSIS